jgi:hypothetical protein
MLPSSALRTLHIILPPLGIISAPWFDVEIGMTDVVAVLQNLCCCHSFTSFALQALFGSLINAMSISPQKPHFLFVSLIPNLFFKNTMP